ncbi:TKL/DRK protein kinase [Pelomyxa schiedti]|nr:TKL/DRK protein kinase [Pelomyxa schiedti]
MPLAPHTIEDVADYCCRDTGLYTGRIVDGLPDGHGVFWWVETGQQYDGDWRGGAPHGRGTKKLYNEVCECEWHQGKKDGWGQWHGPDGETFEGLFRGGQWARGRCLGPDGTLRDGDWAQEGSKSHLMQGWGVERRPAATPTVGDRPGAGAVTAAATTTTRMETVYEGEWDRHQWHGRGTWRSPGNNVYDGEFDHGVRSGYGSMMLGVGQGGGMYVGEWKDDVYHGKGVRIWDDGTRYDGDWGFGKMHGSGKKWERDGTVTEGVWDMGVLKCGKITWPNGDEFLGKFAEDGVGDGVAMFRIFDGRVTNNAIGTLQKGVFKETGDGGGTHCLGCGGSDSWALEHLNTLETANSELEKRLKEVEERDEKLQGKVNELESDLNMTYPQLLEQTQLLSAQTEEFKKQQECFSHVLQHIQHGSWIKSILPALQQSEPSKECVMKDVSVTLERHDITFHEQFCCLCPFGKIVKMEIEKRFGIDENHQIVSVSAVGAHEQAEVPCSSTSTLSQLLSDQESEEYKVQVKVRLTPILDIQEADLKVSSSSLGSGSYGTVFKSKHIPSSTDVAVKTLHDAITNEYSVDDFRLEAEIVSGLRHPNIVKCIGTCNSSAGKLMIVSELMCCSLRQLLRQKNLKFQEAVVIALGIAKGMDALHRQKYMHRDLSSNNILLDANGTPKICDFGVSRAIKCQGLQVSIKTRTPGTPVYMSPQMFTDHYSLKGDVWSFGILTTEMINGEFVDSAFHTLPLAQQMAFLDVQKNSLPPLDVQEVNNLCRKNESAVICCLGRRDASLRRVDNLVHSEDSPYLFADFEIGALGTAPDLLYLVVHSCLSICERNRAPFTVIVQILHCCCISAAIALSASSSSGVPPGNVTQDQVKESISRWLSSLAPTTSPASSPAQPSQRTVLNIKETDLRISSAELGHGTYGAVFRAEHIPTSKGVAVKSLHDLMMSDNNAERLRLEAEIMSEMTHPNIVKCLGMCTTTSGKLLLVSELMCCTLKQLLHKKQLNFQEVVGIGLAVAKGMAFLHKQNYMHRDLNSSNILLDQNGTPKICDFISATKCIQQQEGIQNECPGDPAYMSPQMSPKHFSQPGDVWSFGIVTTEMISGNDVNVTFTLPSDPETFLNEQKRQLSSDNAEEVDRLCRETSEYTVMCCLNRREALLQTVGNFLLTADSPLFAVDGIDAASVISALGTAPELLLSVVQSCLSICESNRQSFTAIVETLQSCCTTTAVALSSLSSPEAGAHSLTPDQVSNCRS